MASLIIGLVGGVVACFLTAFVQSKQKSARRINGWNVLRPSWAIAATSIASASVAALIGYILLTGGSSRPDAATQNIIALLLLSAFVVGAVYMGWLAFGRTIMWRGTELVVRSAAGKETVRDFSDITAARKSLCRGDYRLSFRDGSKLRVSPLFHGATELLAKVPRKAFRR